MHRASNGGLGGGSASIPPTKLFFRIGEVARRVGVEPHVLRYWETEFRSIRPQKSSKGQRVYSRRDVETLLKVKELLYDHGYTIAGAKRRLRDAGFEPREPADPVSREAGTLRATLLELRGELQALLDGMPAR